MLKILFAIFFLLSSFSTVSFAQIYVSPSGNDSNPGTISLPLLTLKKALTFAGPDSLIYLRGGTYVRSAEETISKVGSPGKYIKIWAYPGETPVWDFTSQTGTSNDGIQLNGNYCHLKGLEVLGAAHNGINIAGHYNILENCRVHDNRNSGIQMGSSSSTTYPRGNLFLNCDSYRNYDAPIGGNADGFAFKWNIGSGTVFRGCRAWNNSDDGWDLWMADSLVEIDSCIAFRNGVDTWHQTGFDGNGNGFKVGGNYIATPHILKNCLSFDNAGNTGRGFDENNNTAGQTLYNCTAYRNKGDNYHFTNTVVLGQHIIKNCISYQGVVNISSGTVDHNSWQGFTVSGTDFVSLDTNLAVAPRNADGSLPSNGFFRLTSGSSLIDVGTNVGLPYFGTAPDLGAFESGGPTMPAYSLSVSASNGTVSLNPNLSAYDSNSTVQLTAMPSTGYHFVNWSGDASGSSNPMLLVINGNKTVTANFALNTYTLAVSAINGTVAMDPDQSAYDTNTTVQLTAIPATGYHFVSWTGSATGTANPFSLTMNANKTITAIFAINTYVLNITAVNGTVARNPNQTVYDSNTTVQLTAVPAAGYHFVSWSGDVSGSSNPISVFMNGIKNVTANFVANGYLLNLTSVNGSIIKNPDLAVYDSNATVQLTVSPSSGYHFVNWSGDVAGTTNPLIVTMNGDKNITANFAINTFSVSVLAANGTVVRNPDLSMYDSNSTVQLTAIPATGYHFTGWSGSITGSANPLTLLVDGNKMITANFVINTYSLSVAANNGAVLKNPNLSVYDSNTTVQLSAYPAFGYHFVNWTGDVTGSLNPISVTMNRNKNVTAVFALTVVTTFTLDVSSINGTVARDPDQSVYDSSTTVQLTAIPATGYHFVNWSGDVSGTSNPVFVTMDGNKNITATYVLNPIAQFVLNVNSSLGTVVKFPNQSLYDSNTTVSLTAIPLSGYRFVEWSGDLTGSSNPDSMIMNGSKTISANYALDIPVPTVHQFIVNSNWNMVSFPYTVTDYSTSTLFPTAVSQAFAFDRGYIAKDSLAAVKGYWLKFALKETLSITGSDRLIDSVLVSGGWNIVGSISRPISVFNVRESVHGLILSPFYGYEGAYVPADTIYPGKAYWVKASQAGSLTMDTSFPIMKRSASTKNMLEGMNSITISDKIGNQQKLYFGASEIISASPSTFDLPPPGPYGSFDVRFSSDRYVESLPAAITNAQNYQIVVSAVEFPLLVSWQIVKDEVHRYTLTTAEGSVNQLTGKGDLVLSHPTDRISLYVEPLRSLPNVFSLSANYPNPFNPSTRFVFAVPVRGQVAIVIYDLLGQKVRTLYNGDLDAGYHSFEWNGMSENNTPVAGGMYLLRAVSGRYSEVRKLLLVK